MCKSTDRDSSSPGRKCLFLGPCRWFTSECTEGLTCEVEIITSDQIIQQGPRVFRRVLKNISKYQGVVTTDDWFDVDVEYKPLADALISTLIEMHRGGCSVIVAASMGVVSVPRRLAEMFDTKWKLTAITKREICKSMKGERVLGDSFPDKQINTEAYYVLAPREQMLFEEYVHPDNFLDDSSDDTSKPRRGSPIVSHRDPFTGGSISYFGFMNSLEVSYGPIMQQLIYAKK